MGLFSWLFPENKYNPEKVTKQLKVIEDTLTQSGCSELYILRKQREYLDEVDRKLNNILKSLED